MASMQPVSTLKPSEVAVAMVELAISKHNTRPEKVFMKAVSRRVAAWSCAPFI